MPTRIVLINGQRLARLMIRYGVGVQVKRTVHLIEIDEDFLEEKGATEARVAVARLDRAADLMPDPSVLINTIPPLEAHASTEIENSVTTTDALFRYAQLGDDATDATTKETLRGAGACQRYDGP